MAKKTKKPALKPDKSPSRAPAPAPASMTAPAFTTTTTTTPALKATRSATARYRRAGLSPAGRRGLDAAKYLRIHQRKPFGKRGEQGIVDIVREAAHLARLELDGKALK